MMSFFFFWGGGGVLMYYIEKLGDLCKCNYTLLIEY